jgi:hypothetical protein
MNTKNIIAFSAYGNNKLYLQGIIDNIEYTKQYLGNNWICRIYIAENCPLLSHLDKNKCQIVIMPLSVNGVDRSNNNWHNDYSNIYMTWRLHALDDTSKYNIGLPPTKNVVFRDADSRISKTDAYIIEQWSNSEYLAHRIHSCKEQLISTLQGGLWGMRTNYIINIDDLLKEYITNYKIYTNNEPYIFLDLWFLMHKIWPQISYSCVSYGIGHENIIPNFGDPILGSVCNEEYRNQKFQI